ncbi:hypothetical protein GCM10009789_66860 [Kribbella sancticallisti]|uniref:Polymerase nucleotidyl transferase domain-containing protein n=1 Tax=Kribbella sancticallisti TaxID=460087 RepID=A0ABN2ECK7_9ACTN
MTARLKGRRRQVEAVIASLTEWVREREDVVGLAVVGSYAYGRPRMGSDVDLVLLTTEPDNYLHDLAWTGSFARRPRLIRTEQWGPMAERRIRLPSGLQVELGITTPAWLALPLDPGTARVLRDGHRILHDPQNLFTKALAEL